MPTIDLNGILENPSSSFWLKQALRSALDRDPLDAARDAEILAYLLTTRADKITSSTALLARPLVRQDRSTTASTNTKRL